MKRVVITLAALVALGTSAVYACNGVAVGYTACNHAAVSYAAPVSYAPAVSYVPLAVSVVNPYTPTLALPAQVQYQPVQVQAPAAYEPPAVQAQVAAPAVQTVQVAYAAAPVAVASYGTVGVAAGYSRVGVGVGYGHVGVNVHAARVGVARVGVAAVRGRGTTVTVVRAPAARQRLGLIERVRIKRAAVRAARAAR